MSPNFSEKTAECGVVAIFVGIYQVHRQRGQKQITYQVLADRPAIRIDNELKGRVKAEFDGRIVENMGFVILKVWNSGDTAVPIGDYLEPLVFTFEGREVLEVTIRNIYPTSLIKPPDIQQFLKDNKPSPGNEKGFVELPKFHLNPKKRGSLQDSLTLRILLRGSDKKIDYQGRINEGNIVKFQRINIGSMIFTIVVLIVASVIAYLLLTGYVSFATEDSHLLAILSSIMQRLQGLVYFSA